MAADLIKLATTIAVQHELDAAGKATKMVMQVRDELVFEVPEASWTGSRPRCRA